MGESETEISLIDIAARARARLRERTLPTLAAALVIQLRAAYADGRYDLRAISSAFGIVVLLLVALAAATIDALLTIVATAVGQTLRTRVRFGPATAPVVTLPPPITDDMLLDKRGRPLRGAPRTKRMAMLERQRADLIAVAASVAPRGDLRVLELPPLPPRLVVAFARARQLAAAARLLFSRTLSRASARAAAAYRPVAAATGAAVARIPVPTLPLRWIRIVAVTTTMTFVFATALGTTGIITQQGRVALGASTTLSIIAGEVAASDAGSSDFRPVSDGTLLRAGMTIRTGEASYAVLTYFEGSTVSLEPNTTLLIEALEAHPDGTTVISMQQQLGKTWHSVTKLVNQGSKYEVKTPTLTATVRGTAFEVGVAQSAIGEFVSSLATTEGAVAAVKPVTPADPTPAAEVIVPAGFQTTATASAPVAPPEPAPEPERKVTVTIGSANAVVVDPLGRANGERDGKLVLQTPGAKVAKVDGKLVVTLPNVPDGKISTVIASAPQTSQGTQPAAQPVSVTTVVADRGKVEARSEETVQAPANASAPAAVTGVEVKRSESAQPAEVRVLRTEEKKDAPAPKVVEAPKPTPRPELLPPVEKKEEPKNEGGSGGGGTGATPGGNGGRANNVVDVFVKATLPPLSIEDAANRAELARKAEEKAREEAAKREEERRRENERRAEEARKAEERAKEDAEKRAEERRRAEEKAREELTKRDTARAETARGPAPADPGLVQNILNAIAPRNDDDARRESEKRAEEARKAEEKAREEAAKLAEERRKAEETTRNDQLKRAEEERKQAEKRAEELRKAEEKAKEEAAKELARVREIEAKAREQAQKLEEEKRKEAEKRLEEFRKAEEKAREEAQKRLEEQRRAEERAKEQAERRIAELREQQERAKREAEREQREQEERRREEQRRAEERAREEQRRGEERSREEQQRSNFAPTNTLDPLPGRIGNSGRGGSGRP